MGSRSAPARRAARAVLRWYARHGRRLPWRGQRSAYAIWVSEVMLQQTRAAAVVPYYRRWMRRFPSLRSLAAARSEDVLRMWEGLGFYRRAHHLHQAARQIVGRHGGRLPRAEADLRALPGVGAYTAAALAAIAFGVDRLALDANIRRVLRRVFDRPLRRTSRAEEAWLHDRVRGWIPRGRGGDFNQALMDVGAELCTPRRPRCRECPLVGVCRARRRGTQERPPSVARARRLRVRTAVVVLRAGRVLLWRRPLGGLLGGLWAFPSAAGNGRRAAARALKAAVEGNLGPIEATSLGAFEHQYSHFDERVHVRQIRAGKRHTRPRTPHRWARLGALHRYPMGRVDRRIAKSVRGR